MPTLEVMEATMSGLVTARFPSFMSLGLSLVASVLLLALIRAAFTRLVTISAISSNTDADEKGAHNSPTSNTNENRTPSYGSLSSWNWSWQWEGMALPVSLAITEKDCPGVGTGVGVAAAMQQQQRQPTKNTWHTHRRSVGFEPPLPALYDTPVPASMAKMIMSRHTYRRPSPNRSPPRAAPAQIRSASQPPSRPLHSLV